MEDVNITASEIANILNEFMTGKKESKNTHLTAAEVSNLWTQYLGDSEAICFYTHFLRNVEDKDIQPILEQSIHLSMNHLMKITDFFKQANYPIPIGFTLENDVNLDAPRLFSDAFSLYYAEIMTVHGFNAYSLAVATSEREDIRNYFIDCLAQASELYNQIVNVSKSKGQFFESPIIPSPDKAEFVENKGIISALFGEPKPLNVIEINNILFNMKKTILAETSFLAFSQIAKSAEIRKFHREVLEQARKDLISLGSLLTKNDLPLPPTWDTHITDSTISPFSDKIIMFHTGFKLSSAIAYYGTGMGTSLRADIIAIYSKNIGNVMLGSNDWLTLMVKNGWMEKPPEAVDRKSLAQRQN